MNETRVEQRKRVLAARDSLTAEERSSLSKHITTRLRQYLSSVSASYLHCYISFRSEVETRSFIIDALGRGQRVVVPIVENLDGSLFLEHTEISGLEQLQSGAFGLDEPVLRSAARLESLDAVILPLSAFDRSGNRLGYGKGFYDRFLRELPKSVLRIGLAFAIQEVTAIDVRSHDEPLDVVITERECIICRPIRANRKSDNSITSG